MSPTVPLDSLRRHSQFRFLSMAGADLDEARVAVELADTEFTHEFDPRGKLLFALHAEGALIRYTRPFMGTQITRAKRTKLPASYVDLLDQRQRRLHDQMVKLRHRMVAHSHLWGRPMRHVRIPAMFGHPSKVVSRIPRECATRDELLRLAENVAILLPAIEAHRQQLEPR